MGGLQRRADIRDRRCRRLDRRQEESSGYHFKNVFEITEFLDQELSSPPTPMQHVVYQLTDAKVHAQPTPEDYQPLDPTPRFLLQWATGASAVG